MTQLAQSIQHCAERFARSFVTIEDIMQPFELMNWCRSEDADFYVAAQCVDNLSLHVIHIGFICDLFDGKWLVIYVKRCEASYC